MTQELRSLVEEAKALNNDELNALVIAVIHMQKTGLGYGGKVPTDVDQKNLDELCKETIRGLIDKYKKKQKERNKELSLSLGIAAYLNTLDDIMFTKGMLVGGKDHTGIHDCMKMWQKLHNHYFYGNDTGYESQQTDSVNRDTIKYRKCCLGFLKCEDCAFKGNCIERFNYQCMANYKSEHLYGNDKNYHVMLCEKDKFEELDEKDKEGFISYLTELYNFLYNADILDCPLSHNIDSNIDKKAIEKKKD